jgi:hypothetical protein
MPEFTRRRFLAQSSIGLSAAAMAGAVVAPRLAQAVPAAPAAAPAVDLNGPALAGPIVLHVRDVSRAEVSLLVGTSETIYRDRELVARLVGAARQAAAGQGKR